ncbi:hypothetical protein EDB81DRAFT_755607 [Dactylonectria macrodidyma]|uniref:Uncharacterized protein n=1 Tax=Dactylonectria macrodidyma TaxID=307937 RepID=A0A9P9JC19_9HYPO|nr:hypothetical protein EDB81DRAFT_755607 [Dactylonectria macrodidyma]
MTSPRQVLRIRDRDSLVDAAASSDRSLLLVRAVLPETCYDDCNAAYKIAQTYGKTPELCASGSSFSNAYSICTSCVKENEETTVDTVREVVEPQFAQFLAYCRGLDAVAATSAPTVVTVTKSNDAHATSVVLVTITVSTERTPKTPCTICTPLTFTNPNGYVVTVMVKPGLKSFPTSQSPSATSSSDKPSPTSSADKPSQSGSNSSKATIIGPVVAVMIVIIIFLSAFFFWRHHRSKKHANTPEDPPQAEPKYEKAQLHSDCIPRRPAYELEGSAPLATNLTTSPAVAEMTANEVAAQEMPASQQEVLGENDQSGENAQS